MPPVLIGLFSDQQKNPIHTCLPDHDLTGRKNLTKTQWIYFLIQLHRSKSISCGLSAAFKICPSKKRIICSFTPNYSISRLKKNFMNLYYPYLIKYRFLLPYRI